MPRIRIDEAKIGMVITKDVYFQDSSFLILSSGSVLDKKKIDKLKQIEVRWIDVLAESEKNSIKVLDQPFAKIYDELKEKTEEIFDNLKLRKHIEKSEVLNSIEEMAHLLTHNHNVVSLLRQIKDEDDYLYRHNIGVGMLMTMQSKWLKLSPAETVEATLTGIFHDLGKLEIDDKILNKPGKLNEIECEEMKRHSELGYDILKSQTWATKSILNGVYEHHERENGKGYPRGLDGKKISLSGKMVAVCDVFDAITADRVYRPKVSPFEAADLIFAQAAGCLDPEMSYVFLKNLSTFYVGNVIKLNDGRVGEVIYIHKQEPTKPIVHVEDDFIDLTVERHLKIIDVME